MALRKRNALALSLCAIVLYWSWQLASQRTAPLLPDTFTALVTKLVVAKVITFAVICLLLWQEGAGVEEVGVRRAGWGSQLLIGSGIGVAMFVLLNVMLDSVMRSLFPAPPPAGPSIASYFVDPMHLLAWLPIGILGGGVVEELQRIFVITRFEKWLGRSGLILGVVLSSAMFGFGHRYQGLGTALSTGVAGVVFALVYLRRRSALEAMTAHAVSDVLAMVGATMLARG